MSLCLIMVASTVSAQSDTFCPSLLSYIKMGAANFKPLQADKNEEDSEVEGEDIYNTTEVLAGFEQGRIMPTFTEGKSKLQFYTFYTTADEADAAIADLKAELDACLDAKAGYKYHEDSEIHFYVGATGSLELMRSTDYDDEGEQVYKVLVQMKRP